MMSLGRFRALVGSYGADPLRWPQELRDDAQALLRRSSQARDILETERMLDASIASATGHEDARLARRASSDDALNRLRSGVAARIAASATPAPDRRPAWNLFQIVEQLLTPRLYWAGMAAGGSLAIMAGLLLGATYAATPAPDAVLSMLQPAPIVILAD
jgi:hypothetical protein